MSTDETREDAASRASGLRVDNDAPLPSETLTGPILDDAPVVLVVHRSGEVSMWLAEDSHPTGVAALFRRCATQVEHAANLRNTGASGT